MESELLIPKSTGHYKEVLGAMHINKTLFLTIIESPQLKLVYIKRLIRPYNPSVACLASLQS